MADWRANAECKGQPIELFFPESGDIAASRIAKAMCAECQVQTECLEWALHNPQHYGIFGGLTAKERRRLRRQRGITVFFRTDDATHGSEHFYLRFKCRCQTCVDGHRLAQELRQERQPRSACAD